jgi:hypothetical protein
MRLFFERLREMIADPSLRRKWSSFYLFKIERAFRLPNRSLQWIALKVFP